MLYCSLLYYGCMVYNAALYHTILLDYTPLYYTTLHWRALAFPSMQGAPVLHRTVPFYFYNTTLYYTTWLSKPTLSFFFSFALYHKPLRVSDNLTEQSAQIKKRQTDGVWHPVLRLIAKPDTKRFVGKVEFRVFKEYDSSWENLREPLRLGFLVGVSFCTILH